MFILRRLNSARLWIRWPVKWLVFAAVGLVVLFPRLDRLPTTIRRHLNPNALINAESPALVPFLAEFETRRSDDWDDQRLLKELERYVYRKVPYAWDWDVWGNVDYFPTVEETLEMGKEDCDGRAVVAASVLRKYGYNARLATDFGHVWVTTDRGDTMSPGKTTGIEFTAEGMKFNWGIVLNLPKTLAMGIAVFPLYREAILVLAAWLLMVGRGVRVRDTLLWLALLVIGLLLIREGGHPRHPNIWKDWLGFTTWAAALAALALQARRVGRASTSVPPSKVE